METREELSGNIVRPRIPKWEKTGTNRTKNPKVGTREEQGGNTVGLRTPKWEQERNKVGPRIPKWEQERN